MKLQAILQHLLIVSAFGGSSANYTLAPVVVDHGGQRGTSASYVADFSTMAGGIGTSATYTSRSGNAGQLADVLATAIVISAPQLTVNESATLQLSAEVTYDDLTTATLNPADVAWSVNSGPLAGIDSNGLVTADPVYEDTPATVQGDYAPFSDTLDLTVLDIDPDNFGSYAGDGLGDDWQVQYFGEDNPSAGPLVDPDGDGQNNFFEFVAGLVPTDAQSVFALETRPVPGQAGQEQIIFEPLVIGRTYTVQTSTDLAPGLWAPLTGGSVSDAGDQRTVTDPDASGPRKFYRVEIETP